MKRSRFTEEQVIAVLRDRRRVFRRRRCEVVNLPKLGDWRRPFEAYDRVECSELHGFVVWNGEENKSAKDECLIWLKPLYRGSAIVFIQRVPYGFRFTQDKRGAYECALNY